MGLSTRRSRSKGLPHTCYTFSSHAGTHSFTHLSRPLPSGHEPPHREGLRGSEGALAIPKLGLLVPPRLIPLGRYKPDGEIVAIDRNGRLRRGWHPWGHGRRGRWLLHSHPGKSQPVC